MIKKKFFGIIKKGRLVLDDKLSLKTLMCTLEGKRIELTLSKFVKKRSSNQNKYYWKIIIGILSEYTGINSEELHEHLRERFLKAPTDDFRQFKTKSTTELSAEEMETYHEDIRRFAMVDFGCYIPLPNEVEY